MNLLILGGSQFVGWHIVDAALGRGHDVTVFNRGRTNAGVWPGVTTRRGDRDGGLDALKDGRWDAVIDACGYLPRVVEQSAALLEPRVGRYVFISTESVYRNGLEVGLDEDAELWELADPAVEAITPETYGGLKVLCERVVRRHFGGRALVVRPGLVMGPRDHTDRFTMWVRRAARPGGFLAAGPPERRLQLIDGRDLAAFVLDRTEAEDDGTYNASGPAESLTIGALVDTAVRVGGGVATPIWVDHAFLIGAGVDEGELPLWFPADDDRNVPGELEISSRRARASGLAFRPLAETMTDTLAWDRARPVDFALRPVMTDAREAELLALWRARTEPIADSRHPGAAPE